jgi:hypothetical protein
MKFFSIFLLAALILQISCMKEKENSSEEIPVYTKKITLDFSQKYNSMDGFGVNITPAQWREGNLRQAIDLLVDDLGCTLFRFDCYGKADWLDPGEQLPDKSFPETYLEQVYTSQEFVDAWETFRYLNSKGIEPIFNISGRIPAAWAGTDGERLVDFESYAEMAAGLLSWARFKENLKFSLFMPYNETNLGFPEGPLMKPGDCVPSVNEIVKRLKRDGLDDVKLIVMGDSHIVLENIEVFLETPSLKESIYGFSGHTYGNGFEDDSRSPWPWGDSPFKKVIDRIENSDYSGKPLWITEYGDLDQTGEIEFEFAWRSTRRLIRLLNDGVSAAQAWDAFDNFHEHDNNWAYYGLLKTDSIHWTYNPKKRYFAAKQIYKFVKPGFFRTGIEYFDPNADHVYATWLDPFKNIEISAFASKDGKDLTIVGLSNVEGNVELAVDLASFANVLNGRKIYKYHTGQYEDFIEHGPVTIENNRFKVIISEKTIFTLTTLH